VTTDLNTLLTAPYVWIDDYLAARVRPGRRPRLTGADLLTLAVAQALLEVRSEARWLRLVPAAVPGAFPYLPGQSGYNGWCASHSRYFWGLRLHLICTRAGLPLPLGVWPIPSSMNARS
jgi:hypothetical protein